MYFIFLLFLFNIFLFSLSSFLPCTSSSLFIAGTLFKCGGGGGDRQTDRQTDSERQTETDRQRQRPDHRRIVEKIPLPSSFDAMLNRRGDEKINEELVDKVPQLDRNHFGPKSSVPVIYTGSAFFFIGSECWGKNLYFCDS